MSDAQYATVPDMEDRLSADVLSGLLADYDSGAHTSPTLDDVLKQVSGTIDGWLSARFRLPLEETPKLLTDLACDLAQLELYLRLSAPAPEGVLLKSERALEMLKEIAAGRAGLGEAGDASLSAAGRRVLSSSDSPPRHVMRDTDAPADDRRSGIGW